VKFVLNSPTLMNTQRVHSQHTTHDDEHMLCYVAGITSRTETLGPSMHLYSCTTVVQAAAA
jgi:hypothetical protein